MFDCFSRVRDAKLASLPPNCIMLHWFRFFRPLISPNSTGRNRFWSSSSGGSILLIFCRSGDLSSTVGFAIVVTSVVQLMVTLFTAIFFVIRNTGRFRLVA